MDKVSPKTLQIIKNKGFVIGKELNYGSFARVHKGSYKGKDVAVKIIDLAKASKDFRNKFLPRELEALKKVDHPNIVKIYDIVAEKDKVTFIFMELAEKGDLLDIFKAGPLDEPKAKVWCRQMADALQFLHNVHHMAHRDLKCENVLINKNDKAILTDFGFARTISITDENRMLSSTYCGSLPYVSPEIIRGKPYSPIPADAWSYGVILYVMLHNKMPFSEDMRAMVQQQNNKKFDVSSKITKDAKDLIGALLEPEVKVRLTMDQVLAHAWLRGTVSSPKSNTPHIAASPAPVKSKTQQQVKAEAEKSKDEKKESSKAVAAEKKAEKKIVEKKDQEKKVIEGKNKTDTKGTTSPASPSKSTSTKSPATTTSATETKAPASPGNATTIHKPTQSPSPPAPPPAEAAKSTGTAVGSANSKASQASNSPQKK